MKNYLLSFELVSITLLSFSMVAPLFGADGSIDMAATLRQFANLPQDAATAKQKLGALMKEAQALPPDAASHAYEAICAGLLAIGDTVNYAKVKPRLPDAAGFESQILSDCDDCIGEGSVNTECRKCEGSGVCPNPKCAGGYRYAPALAGTAPMRTPCPVCKGSGKCPDCKGKAYFKNTCRTCHGSGHEYDRATARSHYGMYLSAAIAACPTGASNLGDFADPNDTMAVVSGRSTKPTGSQQKKNAETPSNLKTLLKSIERDYYLLDDVINAGKLLLSTSLSPALLDSINYHSPFHINKSDYPSAKTKISSVVKSAQQIHNDLSDNIETHNPMLTHINDGKCLSFNFEEFIRWEDRNSTTVEKQELFDSAWDRAYLCGTLADYFKISFSVVPDHIAFVVNDVKHQSMKNGKGAYCVYIGALTAGEKNRLLGTEWRKRPVQTREYLKIVKKTTGISVGSRLELWVLDDNEEIGRWKKGQVVVSDGWVAMWKIENSVSVFEDGRKRVNRRIHEPTAVFTSLSNAVEFNE